MNRQETKAVGSVPRAWHGAGSRCAVKCEWVNRIIRMVPYASEWAGLWGHLECPPWRTWWPESVTNILRGANSELLRTLPPYYHPSYLLGTSVGLASDILGKGLWNPLTLRFSSWVTEGSILFSPVPIGHLALNVSFRVLYKTCA